MARPGCAPLPLNSGETQHFEVYYFGKLLHVKHQIIVNLRIFALGCNLLKLWKSTINSRSITINSLVVEKKKTWTRHLMKVTGIGLKSSYVCYILDEALGSG